MRNHPRKSRSIHKVAIALKRHWTQCTCWHCDHMMHRTPNCGFGASSTLIVYNVTWCVYTWCVNMVCLNSGSPCGESLTVNCCHGNLLLDFASNKCMEFLNMYMLKTTILYGRFYLQSMQLKKRKAGMCLVMLMMMMPMIMMMMQHHHHHQLIAWTIHHNG